MTLMFRPTDRIRASFFTMRLFNSARLAYSVSYAAAFEGPHWVLCNFSCSINSSSERTRTEKPHACRKKTSLCTRGFRVKSYSLNPIHYSFGRKLRVVTRRIDVHSRTAAISLPIKFHRGHSLSLHVFKRLRAPNYFLIVERSFL